MNYDNIIMQVLILYIVMFIGALVNRLKIVSDDTIAGISKLMLYVTIPCTVLTGLVKSGSLPKSDVYDMFLISAVSYVFLFLVGLITVRLLFVKKEERPFYQYICTFGNIGFIGYPMIIVIINEGAVLLGAVTNLFYSVLLFSVGIYWMSKYGDEEKSAKFDAKKLINPGVIVAIIGITLFMLDIKLPKIIENTAGTLGGLTSPLAMIVVGASVNKINLRKIVRNYRVMLVGVIRMTVYPVVFAYCMKLIGFTGLPAMVAVVLVGMPVATTAVITATEYNKKNLVKASEASVFSTLLLVFTIPVLAFAVTIVA